MKFYEIIVALLIFFMSSCSSKHQIVYLGDSNAFNVDIVNHSNNKNYIEVGDILKIDVKTIVPEAAVSYNKINVNGVQAQNIDILKLEGYLVDEFKMINYPVIGAISVDNLTLYDLQNRIINLLVEGEHFSNPSVNVKRLNSKFTILGEVSVPGTFSYFDDKINIFQALGYAGDLTIFGKRKNITLIREKQGVRVVHKVDLTSHDVLEKPYYNLQNNDIIIVEPNFSKVKSAGFIGSASTIASISSILLSVTLLIINK